MARRAGRPTEGPEGTVRRKVHLFHQCYSKLLEGWNTITKNVKILQWADGVWKKSFILLGALLGDWPDADAFCGSGPHTCKVCTCPKTNLCDKDPYPLRKASRVCKTVHRAADGRMTGRKLFERKKDGDVNWKHTPACSQAAYWNARKAMGGYHLVENAFWGKSLFDVQLQVCICMYKYILSWYVYVLTCTDMYSYGFQTFKDAMHAYDHGVAMYIIEAIIYTTSWNPVWAWPRTRW